jgi:uncharacterized repeat protein (TIGR04076 family)
VPASAERLFHFNLPGSVPDTPVEEGTVPGFPTVQITVLKTLYHADLAETYRRPDVPRGPCPFFQEGQEFTVEYLAQRPEGFDCEWAWDDLHKIIFALMLRGDYRTWMVDPNTFVACCTDGIKPVVFKIERL